MIVSRLVVRAMAASDVPAVAELEAASRPLPWSAVSIRQQLASPVAAGFVAEIDDTGSVRLVGHAVRWLVGDEAELQTLVVASTERRRGIGRLLLQHVLEDVVAHGACVIRLEVSERNPGALELYARTGFVPIGRRADYYGPGEAALVLERALQR